MLIHRIVVIHVKLHHRHDAPEIRDEPAQHTRLIHAAQGGFRIVPAAQNLQENLVGFFIRTQIIVDQESKGQNLLPIRFLRQLIRFYGDSIERLVPSYLEFSLDKLTREQDRYRKQFANAFGAGAFDAMQEQARQNFAMFEKAMGVFTPFNAGGPGAPTQTPEAENGSQEPQAASSERTTSETDEIAALKAQLSDMQQKLDQLSRRSS